MPVMASKRKFENLDKYNNDDEYVPFDPMSEPLFTQPPENGLDNRRDQVVNDPPDSQVLHDETQDYTCCATEPEPVSGNSQDQDVTYQPESQPLYDSSQENTCRDEEPDPEKEEIDDDLKTKTQDNESKLEEKILNMEQNATSCVNCIFDKELDRRNYYFGNLLIGELQFLPPCMRSEAYITILRYIDSLKKKHRDERN